MHLVKSLILLVLVSTTVLARKPWNGHADRPSDRPESLRPYLRRGPAADSQQRAAEPGSDRPQHRQVLYERPFANLAPSPSAGKQVDVKAEVSAPTQSKVNQPLQADVSAVGGEEVRKVPNSFDGSIKRPTKEQVLKTAEKQSTLSKSGRQEIRPSGDEIRHPKATSSGVSERRSHSEVPTEGRESSPGRVPPSTRVKPQRPHIVTKTGEIRPPKKEQVTSWAHADRARGRPSKEELISWARKQEKLSKKVFAGL